MVGPIVVILSKTYDKSFFCKTGIHTSPGSVTDTKVGIPIPKNIEYRRKDTEKTINRYFNFVITAFLDQSLRPRPWPPTQPAD